MVKQLQLVDYQMLSGDATLTVAVRRSKLASKEKSITRCSDLIVSNQNYLIWYWNYII